MSEIKWIKLFTGIYDDEKIKIIDSMDKRDVIHYLWIRLLIQAAKTNAGGRIFLDENTPLTKEILSILFNRSIDLIEDSLKILVNLRMITIDENGIIFIVNWNKHQNVEGMEKIREQTRKRVSKYREKNKEGANELDEEIDEVDEVVENINYIDDSGNIIQEDPKDNIDKSCNVTVTNQNKTESKNENKREIDKKTKNKTELKLEEVSEADVIEYIKKLNVKIRGSNSTAIKSAVLNHGGENVKLAIDKALEVDRPRINYINGILNNWKIEGYPKSDMDSPRNDTTYRKTNGKKALNFNNFEPRKYDYEKLEKELLGWERD